jgi:hypothetical protein
MKTSQFPAQTSLPSDAVIPYVSGNTNYTITLANFQNSLGVSGTIAQTGTNGVPVLDVQGSSKLIRNLVGGFGVDIQENELNGITISTAFTFDEDGAALVDDPSSSTPTFRSIVAGAGINVSEEPGRITISESGAPTGSNVDVIYSVSDFAIQDATTITLSANTAYIFSAPITTSKRFIVGAGVSILSYTNFVQTLEYTGTGVMFTIASGNVSIYALRFSCPNGTVFSYTGAGQLQMERSSCLSCVNVGTINAVGITSFNWTNCSFPAISGNGLVFNGEFFVCSFTKQYHQTTNASGILFDITSATFSTFEMADVEFIGVAGTKSIKGASGSANVLSNSVATVSSSGLAGGGATPLTGISITDIRWAFSGNSGVEDTIEDALIYFRNNVTQTVIGVANTPYLVAGTWVQSRASKFTTTSAGRATFTAERPITVPVDIAAQLKMASGGTVNVTVYLAKNGSVISDSAITASVSSSALTGVNIHWQLTLNPNDYLEVFVANNTNTINVIADQALLRIR